MKKTQVALAALALVASTAALADGVRYWPQNRQHKRELGLPDQ